MIRTIEWTDDGVVMLDQRKLPAEEIYVTLRAPEEVAEAIRNLVIRGAPAIGVAAAMGIALGMRRISESSSLDEKFERVCELLAATRPTARNLFWAVERMRKVYQAHRTSSLSGLQQVLVTEARKIKEEDIAVNRRIGQHGQSLLESPATVLTHCNAGALATAGYGTALGVVRAAREAGKVVRVFADETRPFLQGARLTAWELTRDEIPCTVITDNMAGYFMSLGRIDAVIVGADRIAANGDTANKIGTYSVAVLAREHGIPFYVAAPLSTIDLRTATGREIPIEQRPAEEVTHFGGKPITPEGVAVENPAFDVTPSRLVTAVITEAGVAYPPYEPSLRELYGVGPQV
ncbi:MAG TPA: S-methyl-5-thioribose-1-phosphate isomerase [Acidobacteriota bacterium]|nr:S-methyl-5-thioribose-1-phosphate isomerase [Acidobacteriota bacterium]HRR56161.1 S-methyl-5-thioribose-1-phosphate isomerase [Acidobacteriota bacterium]HRV07841.1 S-methyl-5-thioribose-1-phosphate isomerase [Acidobacteriota bacterium]